MTYTEIEYVPLSGHASEREDLNAQSLRLAGTMPGCAPWCAYHAYEEGWSEYPGICYSDPGWLDDKAPYLVDEHTPQTGRRIWWQARENATPDETEAFARQLLALVEQARKDGAA